MRVSTRVVALAALAASSAVVVTHASVDATVAIGAALEADLLQVRDEHEQVHALVESVLSPPADGGARRRDALVQLGDLYFYGNDSLAGAPSVNATRALQFYASAAELGDPRAQFHVGVAHSYGFWGLPKDDARAMLQYYFASLGQDMGATMALGHRHWHGLGAPKNCESAVRYYEVAANKAMALREANKSKPVIHDMTHRRIKTVAETQHKKNIPSDAAIVEYYQFSVDKGAPEATMSLATLYMYGARGLEQDVVRAAALFQRAHELGATGAAFHLGHLYAHGIGVAQNNETAFQLLQQASQDGSTSAQNELATMYLQGKGTPRSYEQAITLFKAAAKQGSMEAFYNLGVLHMKGLGSGKLRDPEYEVAHGYFQVAAHQGHTLSSHKLGHMSLHGIGTTRSCKNAVDSFKMVAERGEWDRLMTKAFKDYKNGDYEAAFLKYVVMAQQGYEVAAHNAAYLMDYGFVAPVNHVDASIMLYKWAAIQGNVDANLKIGDFYYYGKGDHPVDYKKASAHYSLASKRSNAQAMFNLGLMYEHGVGVHQDFHLAKRFFDKAKDTHADAFVPATLALWKLKMHMLWTQTKRMWDEFTGKIEPTSPASAGATPASSSPSPSPTSPSPASSTSSGSQKKEESNFVVQFLEKWLSAGSTEATGNAAAQSWDWVTMAQSDNFIIVALAVALCAVIYIRAERQLRDQEPQPL
ncbi:TPA: hypothetical protein N0F65_000788 [Lagenidium giganteum]|uniref:Uncharacterized protein n=1 Tax=Lagenidium giganteum TaxID=4803 RepID=A0AAV2ZHS1_9STRA|nr:TPA: hypothetical protein N0F65_000788 [Lagenidium giganteum]